ncbi:MAG: DoxX family protein [Paracoccaceae bacterium]
MSPNLTEPKRQDPTWTEALGLLLLRVGCAWFIFVWAVNKFLAPGQYAFILKRFDGIEAEHWLVFGIAAVQVVICLMVFTGLFRTYSYAALALIHSGSIYRQYERFIEPFAISDKGFPVNRNATISLGIFLAMLALWLLRDRDIWSMDGWLRRRRARD